MSDHPWPNWTKDQPWITKNVVRLKAPTTPFFGERLFRHTQLKGMLFWCETVLLQDLHRISEADIGDD